MHIYIYTYRYLCSVYMNKYTCIYQYVSSRAGGAKGQPLHVCSLTWGGRLHTQRSCTHIYVYINHIYIHLHTHIFSMHKITHLHVRQSEEMIPAVVGPPRSGMSERQAGWVQGSGARKRSLDGKTNSPHYGGYTTRAVWSVDPPRK